MCWNACETAGIQLDSVCVCVCVREREKGGGGGKRER